MAALPRPIVRLELAGPVAHAPKRQETAHDDDGTRAGEVDGEPLHRASIANARALAPERSAPRAPQ